MWEILTYLKKLVEGALNPLGGWDVNIQDQTTRLLDLDFIQEQSSTTLTEDVNPGDRTITIASTTGFVDGAVVGILNPAGQFYFGRQIGAPAGNVITLDSPMDRSFLSSSPVIAATDNMAVEGTPETPQVFQIGPIGGEFGAYVDVTRISAYFQDDAPMSDDKFGGMPALTYGIVLRQNNGVMTNIWNAKTNGRLALLSAGDFSYTDKAPATSYGARMRCSFGGQEKHGVVLRLAPGETLEILIQEDLRPLEILNVMAQGHEVDL